MNNKQAENMMNSVQDLDEPQFQHRIFVNGVNTVLGQTIVEILRNDNENNVNPHIIVGTLDEEDPTPACRGLRRVINNKDPNELFRVILDSDVIIYDVTKSNFDEISFVIKALKSFNYSEEKTLILVSSILAWSETPQKEMLDERTGEALEINSVITGHTGRTQITDKSVDVKDPKSNYTEQEFQYRRCLPCYEYIKRLENMAMVAAQEKANLTSYVLCAGMVYGHGEDALFDLFETAFEGKSPLQQIGEGRNSIPMIHCDDLAGMIKHLVVHKPRDYSYIHAIDHASMRTQRALLNTISRGMGGTPIQKLSYLDAIHCYSYNLLTLNVHLLPSKLFGGESSGGRGEGQNQGNEDSSSETGFVFKWKYKNGLADNFNAIIEEFKLYRQLKTFRLIVAGLPLCGKSHYSKIVADFLKLPYIELQALIEEVKGRKDAIGQEVTGYLAGEKQRMCEEARAQLEKDRSKRKKNLPDDINEDDYVPELTEDIINRVVQWRLFQSDCLNKGYILDGFPIAYKDCKEIFLEKVVTKVIPEIPDSQNLGDDEAAQDQEDNVLDENSGSVEDQKEEGGEKTPIEQIEPEEVITFVPRESIMPEKIIRIDVGDEENIQTYLKKFMSPEEIEGIEDGPFSEEVIDDKVEQYTKQLAGGSASEQDGVYTFFKEYQKEILLFNPIDLKNDQQLLSQVCEKLEVDYAFDEDLELDQQAEVIEDQEEVREGGQVIEEGEALDLQDEKYELLGVILREENERIKDIVRQEQEILNRESQALKQYITDNILPVLTSGLIEICEKKPGQPLDYLADYLIKKSMGDLQRVTENFVQGF